MGVAKNWGFVDRLVPLAALLLGIVGLIRDCGHEEALDNLSHTTSALEYRPLLKVVGAPRVLEFTLESEELTLEDLSRTSQSDSITDINSTLHVKLRFSVLNVGDAVARIHSIAIADSGTGEDLVRARIREGDLSRFQLLPDSSYFRTEAIAPGDSAYFDESLTIRFADQNSFTIHFLIFYLNDVDALYDTYHWARFGMREVLFRPEFRIYGGQLQMRLVSASDEFRNFIEFVDDKETYQFYDKRAGKKLRAELADWAADL